MSGFSLHKLAESLLPPGLRGDHNHGHDGPDGLLNLGHEGNGHGHDVGHGDAPISSRTDGNPGLPGDAPGLPVSGNASDASPGSPATGTGLPQGLPGSGSGTSGLPGGSLLPGGLIPGLSPSASPTIPSSPLSSVLNLPLAQVVSLTSGLQNALQNVLGSPVSPASSSVVESLPGSILPPSTRTTATATTTNVASTVLPTRAGELTGYRADSVALSQPVTVTPQTLSQGVQANPATAAPLATSLSAAQMTSTSLPSGNPAQTATTAVPQQTTSLPPGRLDTSAANTLVARNDVAFLPGNTLQGPSQLTQSPAGLVQARADIVPATVAPQIAGSTIVPGAQLAQPGQLQSGFVRPGMDGMPVAPKDGVAGAVAGHTAEGVRRRGYGLDGRRLPGMLSWLSPPRSLPLDHPLADDPAVRAAERAYTWLFWVLAIVGYASLAFAIVALVPPGSGGPFDGSGNRLSGGGLAAVGGVVAVLAAWWLVRRSRNART